MYVDLLKYNNKTVKIICILFSQFILTVLLYLLILFDCQADVQRILGFLNRKTLCAYEKDVLNPTNKVLCLLPQLYGVSLDYIYKEDNYQNHDDFVTKVLLLDSNSITTLKNLKMNNVNLSDLKIFIKQLED